MEKSLVKIICARFDNWVCVVASPDHLSINVSGGIDNHLAGCFLTKEQANTLLEVLSSAVEIMNQKE
jgi:hypothetical protein